MNDPKPEIVIKPDGVYEVVLRFASEKFVSLIRDSYGYNENLSHYVTKALADRYVEENFTELSKLIDLDLVKLLATRKLAGIVAKEGS